MLELTLHVTGQRRLIICIGSFIRWTFMPEYSPGTIFKVVYMQGISLETHGGWPSKKGIRLMLLPSPASRRLEVRWWSVETVLSITHCTIQGTSNSINLTKPKSKHSVSAQSLLCGASLYRDLARFVASTASFSMRVSSWLQVGMSWINPITWPAVHTCFPG